MSKPRDNRQQYHQRDRRDNRHIGDDGDRYNKGDQRSPREDKFAQRGEPSRRGRGGSVHTYL